MADTHNDGLQWGRGISAAETWRRNAKNRKRSMLQWGRGISAAETEWPDSSGVVTLRFNGAAAFLPRKPGR